MVGIEKWTIYGIFGVVRKIGTYIENGAIQGKHGKPGLDGGKEG